MNGQPAELSITRMSEPEEIRLHIEIGGEIINLHLTPHDFAMALTGRGAVNATAVRRITRPIRPPN
jgi:hypothetical protein